MDLFELNYSHFSTFSQLHLPAKFLLALKPIEKFSHVYHHDYSILRVIT